MKTLTRFFWLFPFGTVMYLFWTLLTLVFILIKPIRKCCANIASYAVNPFDIKLEMYPGAFVAANVIWAILASPIALLACIFGVIYGATIIALPIAKKCFKIAHLILTPFGSIVYFEEKKPEQSC